MKQIRLIRDLRLNNLEVYKLRYGFYGKIICYMLIVDFKRIGTLDDDFPELKGIEYDEENFKRSNYIKVIFLHDSQIEKELKNELVSIVGGFLENKDDCHWNCSFDKIENEQINKIAESRSYMIECFNNILDSYNLKNKINIMNDEKFNYLSQDSE